MILNRIELSNFRSFYGTHELDFAKNVTVLVTEDGKVKEKDLLKAIQFVLFGQPKNTNSKKNPKAINLIALNENKGNLTTGSVTLTFESEEKNYRIKRSVTAFKRDEIEERVTESQIIYTSKTEENARMKVKTTEEEIDEIISTLFKQDALNLFYIDDRKIEQLADNQGEVIQRIQKDIAQLSENKDLTLAIQVLKNIAKEEHQKVKQIADKMGQLNTLQIMEEKYLEKNKKVEEVKTLEKKLNQEKLRFEQLEPALSIETKDSRTTQQIMSLQKELLESYTDRLNGIRVIEGVDLLLSDYYIDVQNYLNQLSFETVLLSKQAVQKSLAIEQCVLCGNELAENNSCKHHVHLMENYLGNQEFKSLAESIKGQIIQGEKSSLHTQEVMTDLFRKIKKVKVAIEKEQMTVSKTKSQELKEQIENYIQEMSGLHKEVNELQKQIQLLMRQFEAIVKENQKGLLSYRTLKFVEKLKNKLENNDWSNQKQLKERLINEAIIVGQEIFHLADTAHLNAFEIKEHYDTILGNKSSVDFHELAVSTQKKMMFSFVLAIIKTYPEYLNYRSYPLFTSNILDAFDDKLRQEFIQKIAEFNTQWVLFLTDAEFQKYKNPLETMNIVASYQKL